MVQQCKSRTGKTNPRKEPGLITLPFCLKKKKKKEKIFLSFQTELLCRTDADSQILKNLQSPEETVWGVGGCARLMGGKSCETGLW